MGKKAEFVKELAKLSARLKGRPSKSIEDIATIGDNMPVLYMSSPELASLYIDSQGMNLEDGAHFADWLLSLQAFLRKIEVTDAVTFGSLNAAYEEVRMQSLIIHRINYILHETMAEVSDLLKREKRLRFGAKKSWNAVENLWEAYVSPRLKETELSVWCTLQDTLDITYCDMEPLLERVYETVRDFMIHLGWRDVELKARCCIVLLIGRMVGNSFRQFFEDYYIKTHIDFKKYYASSDLQPMVRCFADMCNALGIETRTDSDGFYELNGFNPDGNQRVKTAWNAFMNALRDDDRMDESARLALERNPKIHEGYLHVFERTNLEAEERKKQKMEEGFKMLEEKYKVTRTKNE